MTENEKMKAEEIEKGKDKKNEIEIEIVKENGIEKKERVNEKRRRMKSKK